MAGQITAATLDSGTASTAPTFKASGTEIGKLARAWVSYNGTTQTVNNSFNVSSITRNAAGDYTINFTTALPNANYSVSFGLNAQGATDCRCTALIKSASGTTAPSLMSTTQLEFITGATHATGISDFYLVTATVFD